MKHFFTHERLPNCKIYDDTLHVHVSALLVFISSPLFQAQLAKEELAIATQSVIELEAKVEKEKAKWAATRDSHN